MGRNFKKIKMSVFHVKKNQPHHIKNYTNVEIIKSKLR